MGKNASYSDVLEAAGKFGAEEMEEMSEILHKRAIETRRKEIAAEIKSARLQISIFHETFFKSKK